MNTLQDANSEKPAGQNADVDLEPGDIVKVHGWPFEMEVLGCNFYTEGYGYYSIYGILNPVHCMWLDGDIERDDWFPPDRVTLLRRVDQNLSPNG